MADLLSRTDTLVTLFILAGFAVWFARNPWGFIREMFIVPFFGQGDTKVQPARTQVAPEGAAQPQPVPPRFTPVAATSDMRMQLRSMDAATRQHTLIAARPGDGKTTAMNTLLVADLVAGHQVVVCNPQFTYWHPADQPIDLRPLRDRFEAVYDYAAIEATLAGVYGLVDGRNALYRDGQDVGHVISVIIDEWPSIADSDYGKSCADWVRKLVREARKCNIFVTLAAQDGQVTTLGFSGGVRSSFKTRLCGNVDPATWRAMVGDAPQRPVVQGTWASDAVDIHVTRPTAQDIAHLAAGGTTAYAALQAEPGEPDTASLAARIAAIMDACATLPSQRAVEKELFGYTGGDAYAAVSHAWNEALQLQRRHR